MRAIGSLFALFVLASAGAARADTPQALKDLPPLDLGPIPRFATDALARENCFGDIPVWADESIGYFYPPSHPTYGHSPHGAFTCLKAAKRADYWNIDPFVDNPERGREFPIDPSLLSNGA